MTLSVLLALVGLTGLATAALWADRQFRDRDRLPMNWGRAGQPTWTAPRRVALATVPALAAGVTVLALLNPDRGLASPLAVTGLLLAFGALQAVYLAQVGKGR